MVSFSGFHTVATGVSMLDVATVITAIRLVVVSTTSDDIK
jgi:hypothetical protein